MKPITYILTLGLCFVHGQMLTHSSETLGSTNAGGEIPSSYLIEEINSLSRLLFELAAERYRSNSNKGETWIYTVHEGRTIRKYTDRKYNLVSLPLMQTTDRIALCRYVIHYNSFNEEAADRLVEKEDYKNAREIYKLLLRFNSCGYGLMKERIEKKLKYIDRLESGGHRQEVLRMFKELTWELRPHIDFASIGEMNAITVTNILNIKLP